MRIAIFSHSLLSDYHPGGAHFMRGVATELASRGHEVRAFEPSDAESVRDLVDEQGIWPLAAMRRAYPQVSSRPYELESFDFERALDGVDAVLVQDKNDDELVARLGRMRLDGARFRLLFHASNQSAASVDEAVARDLAGYDGVLAFGRELCQLYLDRAAIQRSWVWHEAADVRLFHPQAERGERERTRALTFVGNWDEARAARLREFVIDPVGELGIPATFYGARYSEEAKRALDGAGARYEGWLPNFRVPDVYARHRVTVHVPRSPSDGALPGMPTIRVFEALACGIPLVCAPWDDSEGLFRSGRDYLPAWSGAAMKRQLALLVSDAKFARELADQGRRTILARHTCAHRVNELIDILGELGVAERPAPRVGTGELRAP